MSVPPLLRVERLEAGYAAGEPAISDLGFAIAPGELVAVLGPNGGGKTTLFRALLGEAPWRRGVLSAQGTIAYVPQTEQTRLDFPVNALDVVLMGTYARLPWHQRVGARERDAARAVLEKVGLEGSERAPYGSLSGGQRRRVLIARALAQRPRILLLDEPLSGVDLPSSERILAVLDELADEGTAVLLATHDIQQARDCDRVLCLNRVQIAFGEPAQALSTETLRRTYGAELVVLPGGERAVVVQHHSH